MVTIAVANQKGGVGKTTIAFNLSQTLASKSGIRVLAIDNDPQGNLTSSFLEDPSKLTSNILDAYDDKHLDPMQAANYIYFIGSTIRLSTISERDFQVIFKLKEALKEQNRRRHSEKHRFDYVIIDCLPSFGHLHLAALNAADYVLIPVKAAPYALAGMNDLIATINRARKYFNPDLKILGIVINQIDGRKPIMEREMEKSLRETYKDLVLKAKINKRVKIEESPAFQKSIIDYDPKGPAAKEFKTMTNEILRRINRK